MIKLEHTVLPSPEQMQFVIEGMRNPMNSWDKSDSTVVRTDHEVDDYIDIGKADFGLMRRLSKAGTEHRKFMRMMPVYVRITAPLYWWKEFDTYKVGTVANSCSTMHKIAEKEFTPDDFSCEHINSIGTQSLFITLDILNMARSLYLKGGVHNGEHYEAKNKQVWWHMIQLLPTSYNQTRNVMLNYEVLVTMYHSRKNHKLDEWKVFCKWIEELPLSDLITHNIGEISSSDNRKDGK